MRFHKAPQHHVNRRHSVSYLLALAMTAVLAACGGGESQQQTADVIFTGQFVTLDPASPQVEALAVAGGRIVAAGARADVERLASTTTQRIDIPGVAVPGWAEGHAHPSGVGSTVGGGRLDFYGMTKQQVLDAIAKIAKETPPGQWISGRAWDEGFWDPPVFPTAADLDRISSVHPMNFRRLGGHGSWVNSKAMEIAGITRQTPDPPGGKINRNQKGEATGILVDRATGLVSRHIPATGDGETNLRAGLQQYARWGVTSVHDAGASMETIDLYRKWKQAGELPVRMYPLADGTTATEHYLTNGPEIDPTAMLTVRGLKLMMDGSLGARGAELSAAYADGGEEDHPGLQLMTNQDLDALVPRALKAGIQLAPHVIGDAAVTRALDAFERGNVTPAHRFRLEHASVIQPREIERIKRLGVIPSMQPVFVGEYSRWAATRLGPDRAKWVMPIRDLLQAGVVVASGTDYPSSDSGNPVHTLYALVTRKGADKRPANGWFPEQTIDVEAALRTMSIGPAYAAFQENDLGQLTVGRYADFTVLSANPLEVGAEALVDLTVRMTVVGGRVTFDGQENRR